MAFFSSTPSGRVIKHALMVQEYHNFDEFSNRMEVQAIKEWICKQPHLPPLTDEQILMFLNGRGFSLQKTKLSIESYYTCRTHSPEIFYNRNPLLLNKSLNSLLGGMLPYTCKTYDGYHVMFGKIVDPANYNFQDGLKIATSVMDLFLAQVPLTEGFEFILDTGSLAIHHAASMNLSVMKKIIIYMKRGWPLRVKKMHVVNTSNFTYRMMDVFKQYMTPKFRERILFYSSSQQHRLLEHIPKSSLPSDFGGDESSCLELHQEMMRRLEVAQSWLAEIEGIKVDESRRLGKPKSSSELFGLGLEGSFKALTID